MPRESAMSRVEVKDTVLWTKGIHGNPELKEKLESLPAGSIVRLRVDGSEGEWKKMQDNRTSGKPTPGLAPLGPAAERWRRLYRDNKALGGILVGLEPATSEPVVAATWHQADEQERAAAWEAFKALRNAGWSSEGRTATRDELHQRERS
jgi:hypothetical protein